MGSIISGNSWSGTRPQRPKQFEGILPKKIIQNVLDKCLKNRETIATIFSIIVRVPFVSLNLQIDADESRKCPILEKIVFNQYIYILVRIFI